MQAGFKLSGRYALEALLGSGGMGEVWRGVDEHLDRPVAVKVLREHLADPELAVRFRREARIAARLQHPGITVVHDVGSDNGQLFIVMELLHGRDMAAVLAETPAGLPVDAAVSLAIQAAEALRAAHAGHVVHRDLKPANLFVLDSGQLKICDFGIARAIDSTVGLTATGQAIGTPAYMSPEQCCGQQVDERSDLYSLGCVLYALLTGQPPFTEGPPLAIMSQHLNTVPVAPQTIRPDVPPEFDRLILELLAKEPVHRPADAGHVISVLQASSYIPTVRAEPGTKASARPGLGSPGHPGNADGFQSTVTGLMGTPSVQPARIARVPRTEAERRHVLLALDPGWEFAHFAGQLLYERDTTEAKYRDREIHFSPPSTEAATAGDLVSCVKHIDQRFGDLMSLTGEMSTTINMNDKAAIEYAFGAQGEDGDPEMLAQLAKRWNSVYEGFLDWASSLRSVNVPSELRDLLELAAIYADEPLEKYRRFVDEYAAQVDEFPARIAAGEPLRIEGSIILVGSKEIIKAYKDELDRLRSRLRDDVGKQVTGDRLGSMRSSGGREYGSAESTQASDGSWVGLPPSALTENGHILVWWLPEYDEAIRQVVAEYQWAWQIPLLQRLETLIPESVLRAWRDSDSFCREYSWHNVLLAFAWGRATQLGISSRPALRKTCSCCSREFLESELSHRAISRLGVDALDVCEMCLRQAFYAKGSPAATPEAVIAVLQALSGVLGRSPRSSDLNGRLDLRDLPRDARAAAVRALRVKPTLARVKELFGSWDAAVAQAAAASPVPLPRYDSAKPSRPADSKFTSGDPAYYRSLTGPVPEVALDSRRDPRAYRDEISSLIGTGYLALAEAALIRLRNRDDAFSELLAHVYGQTAREEQARTAIDAFSYRLSDREKGGVYSHMLKRRDARTIVAGPVFYEPLPALPRGNVRFVLVGGPMEYVDRRGVHACVSGEPAPGGAEAERAESVARMSAMVDGEPWMQAATEAGQAILASLSRAGAAPSLYGHQLSYVTSPFRQIVKALTGALPKKVGEDAWTIAPVGKSRWSYQREAAHYLFNAAAGFAFLSVEAAPAVCIWGWPDRSDSCLQAFLDTVAVGATDPVTVILPDVPAFRGFARRYVRLEPMANSERALMEDHLYRMPMDMPNKRGTILSAEFAPQLVVHPDGSEDDGALLAGAIAYLDAHHTLRLSVWDVLRDALLRGVAMTARSVPASFSVSASDRTDTVSWYGRNTEYDDPDVLYPYRPSLLDAVISR